MQMMMMVMRNELKKKGKKKKHNEGSNIFLGQFCGVASQIGNHP